MNHTNILIKMVLDRWQGSIENWDKHLNSLTDEQLMREISPGKNRGIYLLGHLIAVHDDMLILLDMGERLYPELQEPFLKEADKMVSDIPTVSTLKNYWKAQCEMLQEKFNNLSAAQWFERHTAVTAEDFAKEPHRNKLNIIITRTSHLQYHCGQLALLKSSSIMEKNDFTTNLITDHSASEVYHAINNVRGWWQGEIEGNATQVGDEFDYRMPGHHYSKQKVTALVPNQKIVWLVTDSDLKFTKNSEWTGTQIIFEIMPKENKTEIKFMHAGLTPSFECYGDCSWGWTQLIHESLKSLITTGQGKKVFG